LQKLTNKQTNIQYVQVGIETGLIGKGQIGKGMWAEPDNLLGLLQTKHQHALSGAICAWVPSPTGATIHAIHYHVNNVFAIVDRISALRERSDKNLLDILTPPLVAGSNNELSKPVIEKEINTAVQAILGYVSRWVGQGVGCSKVPDLNNIGKMEDRATLRISSQLLANWLHHEVCTEQDIKDAFRHWAAVVDNQNSNDNNYVKMSGVEASNAYMAGLELVLNGCAESNGYTENILTKWRLKQKNDS
jgi:malate synthase